VWSSLRCPQGDTAEHLAVLLRGHRRRLGTRKGTRALSVRAEGGARDDQEGGGWSRIATGGGEFPGKAGGSGCPGLRLGQAFP
jgi:hypothetical protein